MRLKKQSVILFISIVSVVIPPLGIAMKYWQSIEFDPTAFITQWFSAILFGFVLSFVLQAFDHYQSANSLEKKAQFCYNRLHRELCFVITETMKIKHYNQKADRNEALNRTCSILEKAIQQYTVDLLSINTGTPTSIDKFNKFTKELIEASIEFNTRISSLSNDSKDEIMRLCSNHICNIELFLQQVNEVKNDI